MTSTNNEKVKNKFFHCYVPMNHDIRHKQLHEATT